MSLIPTVSLLVRLDLPSQRLLDIALPLGPSPDEKSRNYCFDYRLIFKGYPPESTTPT